MIYKIPEPRLATVGGTWSSVERPLSAPPILKRCPPMDMPAMNAIHTAPPPTRPRTHQLCNKSPARGKNHPAVPNNQERTPGRASVSVKTASNEVQLIA